MSSVEILTLFTTLLGSVNKELAIHHFVLILSAVRPKKPSISTNEKYIILGLFIIAVTLIMSAMMAFIIIKLKGIVSTAFLRDARNHIHSTYIIIFRINLCVLFVKELKKIASLKPLL